MPARKQGPLRVAVVEPRAIPRRGLVAALQEFGFEVPVCAATGTELMAAFAHHPGIAVVILELEMPKPDGFFVLGWLKEHWPAVVTIGFGTALPDASVQRAMRLGMGCVVDDRITDAELRKAVECMAKGGHYVSAVMRCAWGGHVASPPPRRTRKAVDLGKLSPCELEYVDAQCKLPQLGVQGIADHLKKKFHTVRTLKHRAFDKLGISSTKELFVLGVKAGLVRV